MYHLAAKFMSSILVYQGDIDKGTRIWEFGVFEIDTPQILWYYLPRRVSEKQCHDRTL